MKIKCNRKGIEAAIKIVKEGGIIIFPTDTVYGIGCDPFNIEAVKKIFKIKKRVEKKSLPVLTLSKETAEEIVKFDMKSKKLAEKFWPGPLTLILEVQDQKIKESMNLQEKIAIRVPNNEWVLAILEKCKFLVGTSANISGKRSVNDPEEFSERIDCDLFLDGGKIPSKGESTIIEFKDGKMIVHREGVLTQQELEELL